MHGGIVWELTKAACGPLGETHDPWGETWSWWVQLVAASMPPLSEAEGQSREAFVAQVARVVKPQLTWRLCWQLTTKLSYFEKTTAYKFDEMYYSEHTPPILSIAADVWRATVPSILEDAETSLKKLV